MYRKLIFAAEISNGYHADGNQGNAPRLYYGLTNTKVIQLNLLDLSHYLHSCLQNRDSK